MPIRHTWLDTRSGVLHTAECLTHRNVDAVACPAVPHPGPWLVASARCWATLSGAKARAGSCTNWLGVRSSGRDLVCLSDAMDFFPPAQCDVVDSLRIFFHSIPTFPEDQVTPGHLQVTPRSPGHPRSPPGHTQVTPRTYKKLPNVTHVTEDQGGKQKSSDLKPRCHGATRWPYCPPAPATVGGRSGSSWWRASVAWPGGCRGPGGLPPGERRGLTPAPMAPGQRTHKNINNAKSKTK